MAKELKFEMRCVYGKLTGASVDECLASFRKMSGKQNFRVTSSKGSDGKEIVLVYDPYSGDANARPVGIITTAYRMARRIGTCPSCGVQHELLRSGPMCIECSRGESKKKEQVKRRREKRSEIGCPAEMCRRLKNHRAEMQGDDNRMRTAFLLGIIYGEDVKKAYEERKDVSGLFKYLDQVVATGDVIHAN